MISGTNNEESENVTEQNRPRIQNIRRRDDVMDRSRSNSQKGNLSRNNERYNKPMQGFSTQAHDPQKMREFNKNISHNISERKDQNMNKDVQRNRNCLGPRYRKNDGIYKIAYQKIESLFDMNAHTIFWMFVLGRNANSNNNQIHSQKQEHHQPQIRYNSFNSNNNLKASNETCQQLADVEQSPTTQQQQFSNATALYPVPYNQPQMYNQVAVCGSESETFGGYYQPQANYYPVVYQAPAVSNGDPNVNIDECAGYQVYSPYVYQQAPAVYGVSENWYPVAGPPPAFVPYAPIVSPNTPNNSQAPTV